VRSYIREGIICFFVYLLNCYRLTISVVVSKTRGVKDKPGRMWPPHMDCVLVFCEGWNINSGNYLFTTDTK